VVIECKQRAAMTQAHVNDVAERYRAGCPSANAIIVVNYDASGLRQPPASDSFLVEDLRPDRPDATRAFEHLLLERLDAAKIERIPTVVLLLDCSASMGDAYADETVREAIARLLGMPSLEAYAFGSNLLPQRPRVDGGKLILPEVAGATRLGSSLTDLVTKIGMPDVVLLVSDGGHENPPQWNNLNETIECRPTDLQKRVVEVAARLGLS